MRRDPLVVGIGNPDRGDDAAGLEVVRRVGRMRTIEISDPSELIEVWKSETDVIVVDAMRSGVSPGEFHRIEPEDVQLEAGAFPSTHVFGLAEVVELARALDQLPDRLEIYGIEASSFELGSGMSPSVSVAVEAVAAELNRGRA